MNLFVGSHDGRLAKPEIRVKRPKTGKTAVKSQMAHFQVLSHEIPSI
jgi:hypothetical protein